MNNKKDRILEIKTLIKDNDTVLGLAPMDLEIPASHFDDVEKIKNYIHIFAGFYTTALKFRILEKLGITDDE